MRMKARELVVNRARAAADKQDWYRIKVLNKAASDAPTVAEVYIYDEIGFWGTTASEFVTEVKALDVDEIQLHINSPGGDVFDGVAIYNALKSHPARVVTTVDSLAASAASFIAQAGDEVIMARASTMMIHDAWGIAIGNSEDMKEMASVLDRLSGSIASIYAEEAGGTVNEWRALMQAEVWYTAEEAVEAGLAHSTVSGGESAENKWDLSIFNYKGRSEAPSPFEVRSRVSAAVNLAKEADVSTKTKAQTAGVVPEEAGKDGDGAPVPVTEPANPSSPDQTEQVDPEAASDDQGGESATPVVPEGPAGPAAQARVSGSFAFMLNGVPESDPTRVQAHIASLEDTLKQHAQASRRAFVENLSADNKIAAPQVDDLIEFVSELNDSQYEKFVASWNAAPKLPVLGQHGSATHQGGSAPIGSPEQQMSGDREYHEGIVARLKMSGLTQDQIANTPSGKWLAANPKQN